MESVLILLTIQGVLGGVDNLWHHELKEKLPSRRSARNELALHSAREYIYAIIFFLLAWYECLGFWALFIAILFGVEIVVTILDFLEEDRTRKLPAFERVLHTILAINFGFLIAIISPELITWFALPTKLVGVEYGIWSLILSVFSVGVFFWAIRDMFAVIKLSRVPQWKKQPILQGSKANPRNILITGATGFVGQNLCRMLINNGDKVIVLTRRYEKAEDLFGPHVRIITNLEEIKSDTNIDAIISLAGAPVVGGLWTKKRKQLLIDSRVNDVKSISTLCDRLNTKPYVLINASAIGYYGIRQDELITEKDEGQNIFQSELCQARETAAADLEVHGIRVCNLRIGLVFDDDDGAFPPMARPIKFGLGAVFGTGKQWMSWVDVFDLIRVIQFLLGQKQLSGAINGTAPEPITNEAFTKTVAKKFNRPLFLKIPGFVLKTMLGELSQLFLEGQRVIPEKLLEAGFRFNHNSFESMLSVNNKKNEPSEEVKVYYNEQCPICNFEIEHYKRSVDTNECSIQFNDINKDKEILSNYRLSYADIKRRMYAHDEHGKLVSGVDAFIAIWRGLPKYNYLAKIISLPIIYRLSDFVYEIILVPVLACFNERRSKRI